MHISKYDYFHINWRKSICFRAESAHNKNLFCTFTPKLELSSMENNGLNKIKVMLVEKNKTARWLAKELGKDPTTVSKWCTNQSQPTLEILIKIADLLEVDYTELVRK